MKSLIDEKVLAKNLIKNMGLSICSKGLYEKQETAFFSGLSYEHIVILLYERYTQHYYKIRGKNDRRNGLRFLKYPQFKSLINDIIMTSKDEEINESF